MRQASKAKEKLKADAAAKQKLRQDMNERRWAVLYPRKRNQSKNGIKYRQDIVSKFLESSDEEETKEVVVKEDDSDSDVSLTMSNFAFPAS